MNFQGWIPYFIALIGGGWTLYLFWTDQKWKRHEFIIAEMKDFWSNPHVRDAMALLEGRKEALVLSARWGSVLIQTDEVSKALEGQDLSGDKRLEKAKRRISEDVFDEFLERLCRFDLLIRGFGGAKRDLKPHLDYWIALISRMDDVAGSNSLSRLKLAMWDYAARNKFLEAARLVGSYDREAYLKIREQVPSLKERLDAKGKSIQALARR